MQMKKEECLDIFERYLLNQATNEEVRRLSQWIRNSRELSEWMERQITESPNDMDKDIQIQMFNRIKTEIYKQENNRPKPSSQAINFRYWLRIAAIILLPLLTATGVYLYMSGSATKAPLIVTVDRGQKASVTLPDGSKVWLNSLSSITYNPDYNKYKRELILNGEAYFEVAHNPQKPFIVNCNDLSVEALGTSFGVKAYDEDVVISSILMTGKIKVTTPDGIKILQPNERVMYDKLTRKAKQSSVTNAHDFTGWIHNELRFENESLGEIAKNIQRIYNVEIIFSSERIKKLRYTGTVGNNSLESVLNIISLTSPLSFKIEKNKVMLYENKNMLRHYNP